MYSSSTPLLCASFNTVEACAINSECDWVSFKRAKLLIFLKSVSVRIMWDSNPWKYSWWRRGKEKKRRKVQFFFITTRTTTKDNSITIEYRQIENCELFPPITIHKIQHIIQTGKLPFYKKKEVILYMQIQYSNSINKNSLNQIYTI